jgi:hypothetical protein
MKIYMRVLHVFASESYTTREVEALLPAFEFLTLKRAIERLTLSGLVTGRQCGPKNANRWTITASGLACLAGSAVPPPAIRQTKPPTQSFGSGIGQCRSVFDLGGML